MATRALHSTPPGGTLNGPGRFAEASTICEARSSRFALGKDADRLVGGRVRHSLGVLLLIDFVMPVNAASKAEFAQKMLRSGNRLLLTAPLSACLSFLLVAVTIVRPARDLPLLAREAPFALRAAQGLAERFHGRTAANYTHTSGEVVR